MDATHQKVHAGDAWKIIAGAQAREVYTHYQRRDNEGQLTVDVPLEKFTLAGGLKVREAGNGYTKDEIFIDLVHSNGTRVSAASWDRSKD